MMLMLVFVTVMLALLSPLALLLLTRAGVLRSSPRMRAWAPRGVAVAALLAVGLIVSGPGGRPLIDTVFASSGGGLQSYGEMPSLSGAEQWLNSPPLDRQALKGKVVLVDFWTFDCINCQRSLPYVNQWAKRYADQGLVVIGVHTPEYPFEKVIASVREQVKKLGIEYPVAIDNDYRIWNAFSNQFWPAHYFIDAKGHVRFVHFGEGAYDTQEQVIRELLKASKET